MATLQTTAASSALGTPALLTQYAPLAAGLLRASVPERTSLTGLMAAYHMGWVDRDGREDRAAQGKLVRPSLCLWACAAAGSGPEPALPLACAVEWVHNFTLVHDDIQDGDRERRHRETVWSIWGAAQGINAGDALHALAFELLLAPGPRAARRLGAGHVLAVAVREIVEGQCLDLALEGRLRTTPAAYLRMARAKTGALLGACLEGGSLIGGAPSRTASLLRRAGWRLGLAFQVRDDWLGIWGEPSETGKSRDCDLARRKLTYPVVAGYAAMAADERRRFRGLFAAAGAGGVGEMRAMLGRRGADRLTAEAAQRFAADAVAIVRRLPLPSHSADQFEEFARYVANRQR